MLNKLILGLLLAFAVSCGSKSSGDDDDGPVGPIIDSFSAPATTTLQNTTVGQGWPIPMTISFHDDTENVTQISFSAQGGFTVTVTLDQATKQATNLQTGIVLLYTPTGSGTFKAGTTVDYSVALVGVSGAYGTATNGTIVLQ